MSKNTFTMIDDEETSYKISFDSVEDSLLFQDNKLSEGYEHHQEDAIESMFVYVWEESQQIGAFKNKKEYDKSGVLER